MPAPGKCQRFGLDIDPDGDGFTVAVDLAVKRSSRPQPHGCIASGRWLERCTPYSSSNLLIVSTSEWTASLDIAELPVRAAAPNLVSALRTLPSRAAWTTLFGFAIGVVEIEARARE